MINPDVSNMDRSESFIAVVLDEVGNMINVTRDEIEAAVKSSGRGSTNSARYFLKRGSKVGRGMVSMCGLPKASQHKRRCCCISKNLINKKCLLDLSEG